MTRIALVILVVVGWCLPVRAAPPPQHAAPPAGPPGAPAAADLWCSTVVEMQTARASGVTSAWLSNGVRVHHMRTDRRAGRAEITIALSGGKLLEDARTRGLSEVAAGVLDDWDAAAPEAARAAQMQGRNVRIDAGAGQDALMLHVSGAIPDLEPAMRVAVALLTSPVVAQGGVDTAKDLVVRELRQRAADPRAAVQDALNDVVLPKGDARFQPPRERAIAAIKPEQVRAWIEKHERENGAPIEAAFVGDLSLADALRLADRSLGLLPARPRVSIETNRAERAVMLPAGAVQAEVRSNDAPAGRDTCTVVRGCFGPDMSALADQRALRAAVRTILFRVKKRLGAPEFKIGPDGPGGGVYVSAYTGLGMVLIMADVDPARAEQAGAAIEAELDRLASEPPAPEEVRMVAAELTKNIDTLERDPRYWSRVLARCTATGLDPDDISAATVYYRDLKPEVVSATLARYYLRDRRIALTIRPPEPAKDVQK